MENIFQFPNQPNLYIYNKFKQRLTPTQVPASMQPLPFYFFGSGSSGNSVYLKRLHSLIDLGFPYKKYKDLNPNFFLDVDYVFLTHEHTDHFRFNTFYKILEMFPNVKFVLSPRLYDLITEQDPDKNKISQQISGNKAQKLNSLVTTYKNRFMIANQPLQLATRHQVTFEFTPHMVSHGDILNMAIELNTKKYNIHMLYSSDIDHLFDDTGFDLVNNLGLPLNYQTNENLFDPNFMPHEHAVKLLNLTNPFNLIFLEANYDEQLLNQTLNKNPRDPHANGNLRHISEQEAWQYINYSLTDHGIFIPLHASTTFGTLIQDLDS